ncbi:MAG: hypothetical protein OXC25_08225 [Thiotrichales bacterium]|nr:hypothetical protein [Thiotrichales bacterium]
MSRTPTSTTAEPVNARPIAHFTRRISGSTKVVFERREIGSRGELVTVSACGGAELHGDGFRLGALDAGGFELARRGEGVEAG